MQLIVMANEPRPELMDASLSPPWTLGQAAWIRESALVDTLETVALTPATRRVLALDGQVGSWLPDSFDVVAQRGGNLGNLLFGAFEDCFSVDPDPVILIGMDTPQVTVDHLLEAEMLLDGRADAVIGLTPGGGTWLIGLTRLDPDAFLGVPASGDDSGRAQLERLASCGYQVALTHQLPDVTDAPNAVTIAGQRPGGRFAAAVEDAQHPTRRPRSAARPYG
jgi:uncharacterized protein